jgi:hypothetical protein
LSADGSRRSFQETDILTIKQRRADSLRSSAWWGFGVGAAIGGIALQGICAEWRNCGGFAVLVPFYVGIGSAIGVGVDAMIEIKQIIYTATPRLCGSERNQGRIRY